MKQAQLLGVALLVCSSGAQAGPGISYDHIEGGYQQFHFDGSLVDYGYQGAVIKGSKSLSDKLYLLGSYSWTEADWSDRPGEQEEGQWGIFTIGAGSHHSLTENTDATIEMSYSSWRWDWKEISPSPANASGTIDFFTVGLGLRHAMNVDTEINAGLEHLFGGNLDGNPTRYYAGIMRKIKNNVSVGVSAGSYSGSGSTLGQDLDGGILIRQSF